MEHVKTDPLLGRDIAGRYRIEAKIGEGGMGSVYRARHVVTGKVVAIKVLLPDLAAYDSFVQRFLHEAQAAAYLNHPHAINIIDCGRDGEVVYLLMEFVEGQTLTEVMKTEGPLSAERAATILKQICAVVAEAHAQSIVHRDLKPDNIMLQKMAGGSDYVKVLDFGIAKVLDEQKRGNVPISRNIFVGTPEYASPEQCNAKSPTYLSDIYSLGTILYEMLTGSPPFTGEPLQVMLKHTSEDPPSLREVRPDLPPGVAQVVQRALSKDPTRRQQSVMDLAREFELALNGGVESAWELASPGLNGMPTRPTAVAAHPTERATLRFLNRAWQPVSWLFQTRKRRWLLGLVAVMAVPVTAGGYMFYRWYQATLSLPNPPRLMLPVPPSIPANPLSLVKQMIEEGNRDGAVRELKRLLQYDQGFNPEAHALLGLVYFDQGDYGGAEREFNTAIRQMDGVYPEAQYGLGQLLLQRGQETEAINQFQLAAKGGDQPHLPSLVTLGELALHRGETSKADELFREVIAKASDNPQDVLQVGRVLWLREQYDLAARELRRAIAGKGGVFPEAELYLGLTLARQGDLKGTLEAFSNAALRRGGNYPEARLALGLELYEQGQRDRAIEELRAAIRLRGGNYPHAEWSLGHILADWTVGQYEEAQRQLQLAISHRGGSFPEAEQSLARLYLARFGQIAEARKIWSRLEDKEWLEQTKDALAIRTGPGSPARALAGAKPLDVGDSLTLVFAPLAGGSQAPGATFKVGAGGVKVRWLPGEEGQPARWSAVALTTDGERPLEVRPVDNQLTKKFSAELSVRVNRSQVVLVLDGQEVVRTPLDVAGQPLVVLCEGQAIVYNLRESKSMDIR
jgi:tetratricopeptide (TPR) repeat protein